jgi:folate-binding protein YgfZ
MTTKYRINTTGRIRFEGADAASFLHGLVTNDVTGLNPGEGTYAAWLTAQGRMITDLVLLQDVDRVLAEVPEGLASDLAARFDQLVFSEEVQVLDDTADISAISVFGDRAAEVVAGVTGIPPDEIAALPLHGHVTLDDLRVVRTEDIDGAAFAIWMPAERERSRTLALEAAGAVEASAELLDAYRIEAGRPLFGVDMTTETIPLEAGILDRAISMTKGCYVGQEVIVRILHRGGGRVAKRLVQLVADSAARDVPAPGTPVFDGDKEVGVVTSVAVGPTTGRVTALAMVHRDSAEPGRTLTASGVQLTVLPSDVL